MLSGQKMKEGGTEGEIGARGEGNLMNERARTNYRANKDEIEEINADCTDVQTDQEWNGEGSDIIGAGCCPLLLRGGTLFFARPIKGRPLVMSECVSCVGEHAHCPPSMPVPSIHPSSRPSHRYIGPLSYRIMRGRGSRFNLSRAGKKSEDAMSDGAERSVRMPEEWEWRWGYASLYWVGAPHCTAAEAADADAGAAGGIRTRRIQPRLSLNQQHAKMNMSF